FVDLTLPDIGIVLKEAALHEKDGQQWLSPGRSYTNKTTAEVKWTTLVEFTSRETKAAFQSAGLVAVHKLIEGGANEAVRLRCGPQGGTVRVSRHSSTLAAEWPLAGQRVHRPQPAPS